VLECVLW